MVEEEGGEGEGLGLVPRPEWYGSSAVLQCAMERVLCGSFCRGATRSTRGGICKGSCCHRGGSARKSGPGGEQAILGAARVAS